MHGVGRKKKDELAFSGNYFFLSKTLNFFFVDSDYIESFIIVRNIIELSNSIKKLWALNQKYWYPQISELGLVIDFLYTKRLVQLHNLTVNVLFGYRIARHMAIEPSCRNQITRLFFSWPFPVRRPAPGQSAGSFFYFLEFQNKTDPISVSAHFRG